MLLGRETDDVNFQSNFGDNNNLSNGSNLNGNLDWATQLELIGLQNNQCANGFNISRSGSAPPTVEDSCRDFARLDKDFALVEKDGICRERTEEELHNSRFPISLENLKILLAAQRVQRRGSIMGEMGKWMTNDLVNSDSSSLFAMQPQIAMQKSDVKNSTTESLTSLDVSGMGERKKSFADAVQEGLGQSSNSHGHLSQKPSSHISLSEELDAPETLEPSLENREPLEAMHHLPLDSGLSRKLALNKSVSAASSSSSKIKTSERPQALRSPPPGFHAVQTHASQEGEENINPAKRDTLTGKAPVSDNSSLLNDQLNGSALLQSELDMSLSTHLQNMHQQLGLLRADKYPSPHIGFSGENGVSPDANYINFPRRTSSSVNLGSLANSSELQDPKHKYQGSHLSGYSLDGLSQRRSGSHSHSDLHDVLLEQSEMLRYLHPETSASRDIVDFQEIERVYFEALLLGQQRRQVPLNYQYHDTCMLHPGNHPYTQCIHSPTIPRGVQFRNERYSPFPTFNVQVGGSSGSRNTSSGLTVEGKSSSSLLQVLKNKTKSLELLDVLDHFVEFSMDQYGSRFIQQKLESATLEDKKKIFPWVIPHVRGLMTDVFGNYVIQKFFEHGTQIQRKELADQLLGHILPFSLQMYGCRVIQKALEVVDLKQQIVMVSELDGSVMKCVHDQNGNHVIQKCIECIPQDKIKFIISSFFGQVATLSTHPYGCRVIQRVLEYCNDPNAQQIIMDEIINSVCILAQDQYGNYVVQHVLQHGKPQEKTEIIVKLGGQIVKMSQQKYASNVVEKCLTYGNPEQQKIIITEMLGSTDDNEAFQGLMKDPFGNYVVQKVLETCDAECRELIISRIKVHLNALKKYTYGKHIVSRVEKLIETGERHRGGVKA